MRSDQLKGLNEWAFNLVKGKKIFLYTEETTRFYPDGRREVQAPRKIYGSTVTREKSGEHFYGAYDDEYPLFKYVFQDGTAYYERVQEIVSSAGPCFFLALQDEHGHWLPESLWTEEAFENA